MKARKYASVILALVVMMTLSSCSFNDLLAALMPKEKEYTYNTYYVDSPNTLNPHIYQNQTSEEISKYITSTLYAYDYNEGGDGFAFVPEMAASLPADVTASYVGKKWNIAEGDSARAWLIELRDDLEWEDGRAITAYDFKESLRRLLSTDDNENVIAFSEGDAELVNAYDYLYGGRDLYFTATEVYSVYSEEIDEKLIFTLAEPNEANDYCECAMRSSMGFPSSYDAVRCANYLISCYGHIMSAFTKETAAAMEGKTLAEIKNDPNLATAWNQLLTFWQTKPNEELDFFIAKNEMPAISFDNVGIQVISNTKLVLIFKNPLEGIALNSALITTLGLVHTSTYDACESQDENGNYTNIYGTSIDTYMSFGPYKLVTYEDGEVVLEKNTRWFGYSDKAYNGQYQTTKVVFTKYESKDAALEAFLRGEIDYIDLNHLNAGDYLDSERAYYTNDTSTFFIAMNPSLSAFENWESGHPGYNKSILTVAEFRMALSYALDRQGFINAVDQLSTPAYSIFNDVISSDPENGIMYRSTEVAKDALLESWGITDADIGEGKKYPNKDYAISNLTTNGMDKAKELFNQAYDKAVADGIYNGTDTILITIGLPNSVAKYCVNGYEFLVNNFTEATRGTKLEGKLEFDSDTTLSSSFMGPLDSNAVNMLFGVGWTGSATNPYGLIGAFTYKSYQYDPSAWDTSKAMMQFDINGETYEASVLNWTYAIEGRAVKIQNTKTGEYVDYSCGSEDKNTEERTRLLAALECIVLKNYNMIPLNNYASLSMLGRQVEYGSERYIYGVGYGGVRYMKYNYTDAEWEDLIRENGSALNYN